MKINKVRIKQWDTKRKLKEIEIRLSEIEIWSELQPSMMKELEEIKQIIKYWKNHLDNSTSEKNV